MNMQSLFSSSSIFQANKDWAPDRVVPVPVRSGPEVFGTERDTMNRFSRPGPIEINSNTPIIPEKVYERYFDNYQENEEVEIDEEDLDDTRTSPDLNSTEVSPHEDNPSVGISRPPIIPTRDSAIGCGSDDGMELQDRQRALPRPVVDYGQSIAELEKGFTGLYNY
ncbi:hypothetical protein H5410_028638 [Solanum commersonii]|uniref:Uncharacterized protein n=1 Tax=Solanum commersonii TaxID=4109 RepID=A0A9J5Z387_SOLCO|nr:hypothetical protein H5410_028638 [Solanum commersonii]